MFQEANEINICDQFISGTSTRQDMTPHREQKLIIVPFACIVRNTNKVRREDKSMH